MAMERAHTPKSLEGENGKECGEAVAMQDENVQEWQTVSKKKRNREKRNSEKKANKRARIEAREREQPASLSLSNNIRLTSFIKMRDLQGLVLYLLAEEPAPQWIAVSGRSKICRVVAVQVPGLDEDLFADRHLLTDVSISDDDETPPRLAIHSIQMQDGRGNDDHVQSPDEYYPTKLEKSTLHPALKPLSKIFTHRWPVRAAGEDKSQFLWSSSRSMLSSPIPKQKSARATQGVQAVDGSRWTDKVCNVTHFLATCEELAACEYTIHPAMFSTTAERMASLDKRKEMHTSAEDGWVDSTVARFDMRISDEAALADVTAGKTVIAIDCEMCKTSDVDFELTRLSVVGWDGAVIYDQLVKPPRPITDYLTQFSGITREMLDPVTTTLADVQRKLLEIVTADTIVIGHSLNSDFNALKFTHPYVIDTSIIFPHARGPPLRNSLRYLTQRYLNREMQSRQNSLGHDSIEDARAVLDLVKQKCQKGPEWGMLGMSDEPIYKRLRRTESKRAAFNDQGPRPLQTTAHIAYADPQNNYGTHADLGLICQNDDDVVSGVKSAIGAEVSHNFVWSDLRSIEETRGWRHRDLIFPNSRNDIGKTISAIPQTGKAAPEELTKAVQATVQRLSTIYSALPADTAFVVYSGAADRREWLRLQRQHQQFKREYQTKKWDELSVRWTDIEEQALRRAYRRARDGGLAFLTIKTGLCNAADDTSSDSERASDPETGETPRSVPRH